MKRLGSISTAIALLSGVLSVGTAAAQAPLGFTIDPTQGIRGTTVNGQVNPADVAANCVTTAEGLQAEFQAQFDGPFVGGNTVGELPETFFPDPNNTVYENSDQMAYVLTLFAVLGIAADINGAAAGALPQTFVMTFADFSQKPLGQRGNFDPVTGVGSVVVPDITPGTYPVAATCVAPILDVEPLKDGIRAGGAFLQGIGIQFGTDGPASPEFEAFAQGYLGSSNTGFDLIIEFVTAIGPDLIANIVAPHALGVQLFTITTPTLGFTIDPTSGIRGSTVNGQVNPADIAAHCVTDLAAFEAEFQALIAGPYAGGGTSGELFDRFFPTPEFIFTTTDQTAYSITGIISLGIGANIGGAAETALPQTFVMTFADIATQQPLGPLGHFDPVTGVGSVVVPDLTPGPYPVAATCVRPTFDLDLLEAGIRKNGAFLSSIGMPADINTPEFQDFLNNYPGANGDLFTFLNLIGPTIIQNIVTPGAIGVQFFTITTPTLGFTIDPTSGLPGDTVNGQVSVADIDAHCVTDLTEFQAEFESVFTGPYASGGTSGELFDTFFPGGEFVFENTNQSAYSLTGFVVLGIAANINGAADTALPQTFVMTFADILTQQPLGPLGHFDPATGVGSVVVPNLDPGVYPIAATCVRPTLDVDLLAAGIMRNGAYLASLGMPPDINSPEFEQFVADFLGGPADLFAFLNAIGPTLVQNIVTPGALGVQFYTILNDLNHFQCYRARNAKFSARTINVSDRFGTRSMSVRKAIDICPPTNKNNEDPDAPDSPDFLTSYKVTASGGFTPVTGQVATNQFGTVTLNVNKPKRFMVPTAFSDTGPPASPDGAFLNHYTCYDVKVTNGSGGSPSPTITVQNPFETVTVTVNVKKPQRLCVQASKNGEPVTPSSAESLLCYKEKSGGALNPAPTAFLANQFGSQVYRVGQRREICVPTDLAP